MYALEMMDITKEFPGVKALDRVSFKVKKGEIHALCGENGAGKSTLMKVLSGLYPVGTYSGTIRIDGQEVMFRHIVDAENAGIAIIHQELALVKEMTVGENLFLGREPKKFGIVQWDELYYEAEKWLKKVGLDIAPQTKMQSLGIGQQQLVEIAKALAKQAKILILDEPTAALTESEVEILLGILEQLRSQGVACIYISHKMPEVFRLADSITVLRDGKSIATLSRTKTNEDQIVSLMVGRELTERYPYMKRNPQEVVLEVKHYSVWHKDKPMKVNHDIDLSVRKGEIVGIAGLMGAGRTELAMSLFGAYEGKVEGEVWIEGKKVRIRTVQDAIREGIALVTEDRKRLGLVLGMDVKANTTLASLKNMSKFGVINQNEELKWSQNYVQELRTKTASLETPVGTLSGGNQQKVVLAKWLMAKPKILILDEPTRGIDVGAKYEIYHLMNKLAEEGVAIIMISSELPEILGMSDRILVMREGRIVKQFTHEEATQENIMMAATGGK
ncbi:xylose ABC transporter ATP-binding protein [Anoxybacillus rupiensis]|jgi:D-xylose transport system ATP-binding protein|uniref:Xylose ABC transporter ATP-binding protein n=1 Tax=Anoxybacteroides rupiense TaxID=311460 RepID=A0ABD5J226_9BACL|nr:MULTISPECIES: xylose ABC transporter ATP-binding protein [Anoxybacillus]KXG10720.1 Xylose import ATP-binding protein XylG [Anoxybacillus sp. P3H1B]MBB3905989.1 D-xylose transport system ATP-binding protein [Anoxybacillus rupiensis]MBS2772859.1 xylose ABC transporter ATP-binding protein [Anoxybacillus rupiensis]MDE8563285.1 xylose ABC transporter ATP-binding protein [Anoxybacillus rupiensis]MED5053626.1 xylose ABC transporter ATP-binding protein [Anoxybacillus rupiensis]